MSFAMPLNAEAKEALAHGERYLLSCRCITEDGVEFTHMDPLAVPGGQRAILPLGLFGDAQTGDLFVPVKICVLNKQEKFDGELVSAGPMEKFMAYMMPNHPLELEITYRRIKTRG